MVFAALGFTVGTALVTGCTGSAAGPRVATTQQTASISTPADQTPATSPTVPPMFVDEFNGTGSPDARLWESVNGRRHEARQTGRLANLRQEGGNLVIEARHEAYAGSPFTSAMIKSRQSFRSGRFEARMKLPTGAGTWPAFWLVGDGPWPDAGEIDVVEHYGRAGTGENTFGGAESNLHSKPPIDQPRNTSRGRFVRTPIVPDQWHVYGVEWRADEIRFSIDGTLTEAHKRPADDPDGSWPFDDHPESIVFDLFLGGIAGPVDAAALPQQLLVDWVRVWPVTQN